MTTLIIERSNVAAVGSLEALQAELASWKPLGNGTGLTACAKRLIVLAKQEERDRCAIVEAAKKRAEESCRLSELDSKQQLSSIEATDKFICRAAVVATLLALVGAISIIG